MPMTVSQVAKLAATMPEPTAQEWQTLSAEIIARGLRTLEPAMRRLRFTLWQQQALIDRTVADLLSSREDGREDEED
jgi:hypothetical protein